MKFLMTHPHAYNPTPFFSEITTWLNSYLLPSVVGLFILGLIVRISFKVQKKHSNSVGGFGVDNGEWTQDSDEYQKLERREREMGL